MGDYATRLAAHPRWEWQIGMVAADYGVVSCLGLRTVIGGTEVNDTLLARAVPDIQHPATQGWLIRWLVESGRLGGLRHDGVSVYVIDDEGHMVPVRYEGDKAVAAALLAAWGSDDTNAARGES